MLDQLSPIAPARVRVVLLPIGQIKRARFLSFIDRLQPENVVQLGDISPDGRPHRNMFSPLAFPTGRIVYDLTTFYPPPSHVALSPFEIHREPLVIIALADGVELDHVSYRGNVRRSYTENGNGPPKPEHNLRELYQDLEDLRDRYPKALVHQLMLFDYVHKSADAIPEGLVVVPPPENCRITTMKTIMCDLSSMLLAEMTTLAKSLQALSTIESPIQLPSGKQSNGASWNTSVDDMARRNSQFSLQDQNSRSGSPAGADRNHVRMSMPAQLRRADSNSSSPLGRPSTPTNGTQSSATTFDDNVGSTNGDPRNPLKNPSSRFAVTEPIRDTSRDRVSVQGFGSNSVSERSRNRGKGRIGMVLGSLYLQAGRWGDAMKELIEAVSIAKANLDHLWHAKALDNIVVSMLMLAWAGLDFQIPQVCYVSADKAASASNSTDLKSPASNRLASLQNLTILLPELVDRILNLYTRSANNTGESLPQFPFSESVLRLSKLLSSVHLAGGSLDDSVLQFIVLGVPLSKRPNLGTPRLSIRPTRTEIVTCLFRALPVSPSPESLSVVDRIIVYSGIASVLGSLGYNRKKAMIIRELVTILIPGLVQARIKGAAEMGVHPAAGLASLSAANGAGALDLGEGDVETGVDVFLGLLSETYGVVTSQTSLGHHDYSDEATISRIVESASLRAFGGQNLKMDVLRSCINLSEALPDFHGVLRFTADLLRTAGSGIAPGFRSDDAAPSMTREEQIRLFAHISRTIGAARNLGMKDIAADYWDEFLVRGVELDALPATRTPIPHRWSEIPGAVAVAASREVNPFIYNPFLRAPDASAVDRLLIAGETALFKVTLQNPYDFDIEIESVKLETDGAAFESVAQKTVIGAYRTQFLSVSGIPREAGQLKMTGCIVRVRGCRERRFPIFQEPWSPQRLPKIKSIGVATVSMVKKRRSTTEASPPVDPLLSMKPPKVASLELTVIERQPVVIVKSTTLSQSAVMILEGERQTFSITLQNLSKETPVDLLLFSFKDSTQGPLQTALTNRDASPAELYECELIFARKQAMRWKQKDNEKPYIAAGATASFEIEILGRPGLTSAFIQIDYAHMGVPAEEYQENFHTRQVTLPITVTVNASVELARLDVLPLTGSVPNSLWAKNKKNETLLVPEDYCLLVLDLRNSWPSHLQIHLEISDEVLIEEEILPGNTSRIMFPIRRIFLENPSAAIPALDPSRQRQFVVSTGRISADSERAGREAFWYREEILKMLRGSWSTKSGPERTGEIELRAIRLSQRMIEAIRVDDIGIEVSVHDNSGTVVDELPTDRFAQIKVRITNRAAEPILPLLRIQPSVRNQPHSISLDLSKKFVWNGTLQQSLPRLAGRESTEIIIGMTTICRGDFEISASVEEAKLIGENSEKEGGDAGGKRQRANTKNIMDALLGVKERRIWHSREACVLVVRDEDDDESDDSD